MTTNTGLSPMASAPMKYDAQGAVDWGNMWDSFCVLALEGGPPHRPTLLEAQEYANPASEGYRLASAEICRAVRLVSGLRAEAAATGWIAIFCPSPEAARWLSEAIVGEGVAARCEGARLFVPCGQDWTLKGEIKNVVTAVAKTTHYYADHLPNEVKLALWAQRKLARLLDIWPGKR